MLFVIYVLMIILCIVKPKSKKCFFAMLFLLWFISAFSTNNADWEGYQIIYNYSTYPTEYGFNALMSIYHFFNFKFEFTLLIDYLIVYGLYGWFIYKNTDYKALVLAVYSIFPFCMDAIQIRNSMAFGVALIGINELLKERINYKSYIKCAVFIMISALFHNSCAILILLLFAQMFSIKTNMFLSLSFCIIFFAIVQTGLIKDIGYFVIGNRMDDLMYRLSLFSAKSIFNIVAAMAITLGFSLLFLYFSKKNSLKRIETFSESNKDLAVVNRIAKCQIMIFATACLVLFFPDLYRLQRYCVLLTYIGISKCYTTRHYLTLKNYKFNYLLLFSVLMLFFVQVVKLGNFDWTFVALMKYNKFIP